MSRDFYVKASSVNAVRRASPRPRRARVVGRFDRETVECDHTMNEIFEHSPAGHWPVLVSRMAKAGLPCRRGREG